MSKTACQPKRNTQTYFVNTVKNLIYINFARHEKTDFHKLAKAKVEEKVKKERIQEAERIQREKIEEEENRKFYTDFSYWRPKIPDLSETDLKRYPAFKIQFQKIKSARKGWFGSYRLKSKGNTSDWLHFLNKIKPEINNILLKLLKELHQCSYQISVYTTFYQETDNSNTVDVHFTNKMNQILNETEIIESINKQITDFDRKIQEYLRMGSGRIFEKVIWVQIEVAKYKPLKRNSYVELPDWLKNKKAMINVKNEDNMCFKWSILPALHTPEKDPQRVSKYKNYENKLNLQGIDFPVKLGQIQKFETPNNLAIFIYHLSEGKIQPLRRSKMNLPREERIRLFLFKDHYMWIKNMSRLLFDQNNHNGKKHSCDYCCQSFNSETNRNEHENTCQLFDNIRTKDHYAKTKSR